MEGRDWQKHDACAFVALLWTAQGVRAWGRDFLVALWVALPQVRPCLASPGGFGLWDWRLMEKLAGLLCKMQNMHQPEGKSVGTMPQW